ncbi:McrC family protein [Lacimonas salitolerans]|uniref:McrC family protein n=1 Tax=Lacimonas salitolerans TaxID=1323750 RepID=A0ABW4EI42_9RHOB
MKFGPFCGVLQTEQLAIEILPKIDHGSDSSEDMRGLLVAMLARVGELGSKRVGEAGLGQQHSHLLDVFIEDFCSQVKSALRGGAIARYSERTENLNAIRGRLELTEHLRTNAFDRSHLLCRFDERSIDNPYNQALKAVLRILLGLALSPRTRAMVAAFLHRFDEVTDRRVRARDVGALRFDRTIRHWEPVFVRARWLLTGLYPDVRIGDAAGSALLFNMEKLFETVLGLRIRHACQVQAGAGLTVGLQSPVKNLATAGFQLRPDITVQSGDECVAIFDAKWKRLDPAKPNSGVSSGDAYQMNAYASRYRCRRLALVYPASRDCPPGRITEFVLMTEERPVLDVVAIDVRELAFGSGIPAGLDAMIPIEPHWKQRSSQAPIYEAV